MPHRITPYTATEPASPVGAAGSVRLRYGVRADGRRQDVLDERRRRRGARHRPPRCRRNRQPGAPAGHRARAPRPAADGAHAAAARTRGISGAQLSPTSLPAPHPAPHPAPPSTTDPSRSFDARDSQREDHRPPRQEPRQESGPAPGRADGPRRALRRRRLRQRAAAHSRRGGRLVGGRRRRARRRADAERRRPPSHPRDAHERGELTYAACRSGLRAMRAQASRAPCAQANEPRLRPRQDHIWCSRCT